MTRANEPLALIDAQTFSVSEPHAAEQPDGARPAVERATETQAAAAAAAAELHTRRRDSRAGTPWCACGRRRARSVGDRPSTAACRADLDVLSRLAPTVCGAACHRGRANESGPLRARTRRSRSRPASEPRDPDSPVLDLLRAGPVDECHLELRRPAGDAVAEIHAKHCRVRVEVADSCGTGSSGRSGERAGRSGRDPPGR